MDAVITFNEGTISRTKVIEVGTNVGQETRVAFRMIDELHVKKA